MSGFETRFAAGHDAEGIRTAFYDFVGAHGAEVDGDAWMRTEISNAGPQILVRLWSAQAMSAFLRVLPNTARPGHRQCYE